MTKLNVAKSRSSARTEDHVAYRGAVANPVWEGFAICAGGDTVASGNAWGHIGHPNTIYRMGKFVAGGTTSVTVFGDDLTSFNTYSPATCVGGRLRVMRITNGVLTPVRTATITGQSVDFMTRISPAAPITQNSFEHAIPSFSELTNTYTYGVAVIDAATGLIGPISKVSIALTGPTYTVTAVPTATTNGTDKDVLGRNNGLAAITGLTAQIKAGTTHNIQLAWDAASPTTYVVFINWDGTSDRLNNECTLTLDAGPAILSTDLFIYENGPFLVANPSTYSNRAVGASGGDLGPPSIFGYNKNIPGGRSWQYEAYDAGFPKPDITYPNYYLQLNGNASTTAKAQKAFHAGTDQSFYEVLVPGRTYRAEFIVAASAPTNATFSVESLTPAYSQTVALTTTPQTFTFDFTTTEILKTKSAKSWNFEALTNNVSLKFLSIRVWDTSQPFLSLKVPAPVGSDFRDHNLIKQKPTPHFDAITGRPGHGRHAAWSLASLLQNCRAMGTNPHIQIEWFYPEQNYYDLITFLCAPASSNEPLALKREALGFGPIHEEFSRWLYEDGNERWNSLMWAMFGSATDSANGKNYSQGEVAALFSARRRQVMMSNPYWPTSNPPKEYVGGWLANTGYTVTAANYAGCDYTSVALYNSGWDVNKVLLADNAARWRDLLASPFVNQRGQLNAIKTAAASVPGLKLGIYEAGPGYQLNGLNGALVTSSDAVAQEVVSKSIGGTTSTMLSLAQAAMLGFGPYCYFTWNSGDYWSAIRRNADGGGLYRVAGYLKAMHELLGRCIIRSTDKFLDKTKQVAIMDSGGNLLRNEDVSSGAVFHFESITYPGRIGILFTNTNVNYDAFGSGHPDYQAGVTGSVDIRYWTGMPASATPYKVLKNEGNMRWHDAYKVGFRPNVVGGTIDGYVADPLCVDLTVTPEDFTVSNPGLRTVTLLGGNCRLETYNT